MELLRGRGRRGKKKSRRGWWALLSLLRLALLWTGRAVRCAELESAGGTAKVSGGQ